MMAGFTNFTTAKLNGKTVYLPIKEILKDKVNYIMEVPE